ncbi:malignant fibrous histiocytoma-amplified sequence 1 homolog [Aplysia californica]|uniref:Malignant fibrous histiocytoma-amplified sequence 1 homolog n=1 Tax=Aplysia californica TaxID=6500 RepID=A0ABM1VWF2_APLCA|nr:malignant fibrous histiocytoma-amplified sequence 1 homolog [Aplysia californica]
MSKSPQAPILVKSKSDMSPTRSVKFDLSSRRSSAMSSKSPPRKSSPGKRTPSASPPKSSSPAARRARSKDSGGGGGGSPGTGSRGRKPSKSPPKSAASGGRKGSSQSPAARAQSGKTSRQSSKGRAASKDGSAKDKKAQSKSPELTESGLKIVDWSGQGMTTIPSNLVTAKDVGHLILASNNLRSLPVEIRRMRSMEKLDLSKNGIRCTNSGDFSGLPQEMSELVNLTELSISECNLPYIPPAIFKIASLKYLDLSRNKVNILLPEIGQLENLVKLNLQQTNITSLPPEIAYCQELEEVYLWGNSIETLPETLPEMPKLRVLALNYRSFCGVVDPYMENLLKKGQIKSEHIPTVVFELPALEVLDLESTKLNTLPEVYNIQLKEFYLCKNFLQTIPPSIYNLKYLRVLDMSNNLLTNLPEDIGRLKGLRVLRLSCNNFERVPPTIGHLTQLEELNMSQNRVRRLPPEIKGLTSLQILILERNNLQSLPEELCELRELHTLDVTDNEIRALPMAMHRLTKLTEAHGFHKLEKCGLWLYKNPLDQPPPEIWRTEKPENIFEYLKKLMIIKTENLQRQKIQVLGSSQGGKTSLVNVLSLRKSLLTRGLAERTRILQQTMWKTENNVEFVLNDFGGDPSYRILYQLFLDSKALVLLVYNAMAFTEESFYPLIGQWLDMLSTTTPGAVVKIVGTQVDLLHPVIEDDEDDVKTISSDHELKLLYPASEESRSRCGGEIEEEEEDDLFDMGPQDEAAIARNTSTPAVPEPPQNEVVKDLVNKHLKNHEEKIQEELESLQADIAKMTGKKTSELTDIEDAALKMMNIREQKLKDILKTPLKVLPEVAVVSASDSLEGILPLINELEHLAIDQNLFPHAQRHVPAHWNRMRAMLKQRKGYYLYWDDLEATASLFSIKGEELRECILYLHDTADVLWYQDVPGLSEIVFHKPKTLVDILASLYRHDIQDYLQYENKVFLSKGRLSREQFEETTNIFLHTGEISRPLLNCLWFHMNFKNDDLTELLELLPLLEVCYAVPEPDVPIGPLYNRPLMVVPWYNEDTDFTLLREVWPAKPTDGERDLTVIYTFPFYYPPEIIPSFSAQIHEFVDERLDWKDFIYAACDTEKLIVQHSKDKDSAGTVTIVVRGPDFTEVQDLMRELVEMLNTTLLRYPSLYWKLSIPMGGSIIKALAETELSVPGNSRRASRLSRSTSFKN